MSADPAEALAAQLDHRMFCAFERSIGRSGGIGLRWADEMPVADPDAPLTVTDRDGRNFEVAIEVTVVELTADERRRRAADAERYQGTVAR